MVSRINTHAIGAAISSVFFGGTLIYRAVDHYRRKLKIEDTGTIPIKSAPQGFVELEGFAWPQNPGSLTSILNNNKVVFFMIVVEEYIRRGKSSQWVKIYEEKSNQSFFIADSSGVALVSVDSGECDLTRSTRMIKTLTSAEKTRLRSYLASRNIKMSEGFFDNYRVTEGVIHPGSPLCLTGFFQSTNSKEKMTPAPGLQQFLLQLNIAKRAPVWAMQHPIASGDQVEEPFHPCYGVVRSNDAANEKLFFADCHRVELLSRLSKHLELRIIGGSLLITLGVVILIAHLHFL